MKNMKVQVYEGDIVAPEEVSKTATFDVEMLASALHISAEKFEDMKSMDM